MDYVHIETYIDKPSFRVNIVENKNGLRIFQLEKFHDKLEPRFYSTRIEEINTEIEKYLFFQYTMNEGN